jgi:YcxB-like protein
MLAEGSIKERDYIMAQFLHIRPRPVFTVIGTLLLAVLTWAVFMGFSSLLLFGAIAYLIVFFFVYTPWWARKTFLQYKALSESVSMQVRSDGLFFKRQNGEELVPWSYIVKWRNNKKLLLLYPANNVFYIVPNHFFAKQEDYITFIDTVKGYLGNAK